MNPIETVIANLRHDPEIQIAGEGDEWELQLDLPAGFNTKMSISGGRLAGIWSARIIDNAGVEVWRDRADYFDDEMDDVDLRPEIASDVAEFIEILREIQDFRVRSKPLIRILGRGFFWMEFREWLHDGEWKSLDFWGLY